MNKLFFDIETIPCDEEGKAHYFEILKKRAQKNGRVWINGMRRSFIDRLLLMELMVDSAALG